MLEVSIIIPCYNEEDTIQLLLEAVRLQTFPLDQMEVVIADGISNDGTINRIDEFRARHREMKIRLVQNPKRSIPSGLNRAIEAAAGALIVRLDAHSIPDREYVERCVKVLKQDKAESVGGVWEIQPRNTCPYTISGCLNGYIKSTCFIVYIKICCQRDCRSLPWSSKCCN